MEAKEPKGRRIGRSQRGVIPWQALVIIFGIIAVGIVLIFAAAFILVLGLLIIGGLVMLLGPKPYGIWVGLGLVLLAFLAYLAAQNNVLHLAIAGSQQLYWGTH